MRNLNELIAETIYLVRDVRAYFESPRNSQREGSTSLAEADALASLILEKLAR